MLRVKTLCKTVLAMALAAMSSAVAVSASAATIGTSFNFAFEETASFSFGPSNGPDFSLSDVLSATITQTAENSARVDFQFGEGLFTFAGFFLKGGTDLDSYSGGELIQYQNGARSVFGDRGIPLGISFDNGETGFSDGDVLSLTLSRQGLDVNNWDTFLQEGNVSGLFGGISYFGTNGSVSVYGITGQGSPALATVPLPAGALLLLSGVGLLVISRRKAA